MLPPDASVVIVRHGEVGVKSDQVRRRMVSRMAGNLQSLLADRGIDGDVSHERNRLFIDTAEPDAATKAATDCFGVVSASPALIVDPTMDAIRDGLARTAGTAYEGGTFAVRARRGGGADTHDFESPDVEREGGAAIWEVIEAEGGDPEVDLDDPDFEVFVECRPERAYVFLEKRDGPGGLPLGTQAPMVALVSGGIDSPVAAWDVMTRGSPIVPVYVDLGDLGGPDHRARAISTVESLTRYAPNFDLDVRVVPAGEVVSDLEESMGRMRMLALRRFMVAVGGAIATAEGGKGIVTGEAIGQKSSQTASNLAVTDDAVDLPVHRPNLTRDKTVIVEQARDIGTFEESTIPAGCNRVAPSLPATRADLADVRTAEPDDLLDRARAVAADAEIVRLGDES
jgi:thiamine biosynthesis protein ThiI